MQVSRRLANDCGYISEQYAKSFDVFGEPVWLNTAGGYILERPYIPAIQKSYRECYYDAMSLYPLFQCQYLNGINQDFDDLKENEIISLVLIVDPFLMHEYKKSFPVETLSSPEYFPDLCSEFKPHVIVDSKNFMDGISKHHKDRAFKALEKVSVSRYEQSTRCTPTWHELYKNVVQRNGIPLNTIKSLPYGMKYQQSIAPGFRAYRAVVGGSVCGIMCWFVQGDVAYSHSTAMNDLGRNSKAGFALYMESMRDMITYGVFKFDLGSYASTREGNTGGLEEFKKGWSQVTMPSYILGKVLDKNKYNELSIRRAAFTPHKKDDYFPSYRYGEFL